MNNLDLTINEYKVLKSLQSRHLNIKMDNVDMSKEVIAMKTRLKVSNVDLCIQKLLNSNLIKVDTLSRDLLQEPSIYYELTEEGKNYLDDRIYQKRNKIIWSIMIPLAISISGTILTNILFPK